MSQVGFGLIGMGAWAREVHIPNLLHTPSARITALASRSEDRLRAAADLVRAPANSPVLYADYRDLLRDPAVDAVIVCTPNNTHEAMALEALAAGKHVLCEKPLSFSLEGCERVRAAATSANRIFQVGLELRYADVAQRVKSVLDEGLIGPIRMVHCLIWRDWGAPAGWRAGRDTSGGIYLELGVHYLDGLDWLAGGGPTSIYSTGGKALGTEITDHFWTTMTYRSGVHVDLGICVFAPAENLIPIEIVGDRGRIAADVITGKVEAWLRDGRRLDLSPARPENYRFDGFPGSLESLEAFVQCIQSGSTPLAGIDAATRATALALAAEQSELDRRPVEVE